jgi:hypothetical protein
MTLYGAGMRHSELAHLKVNDIDSHPLSRVHFSHCDLWSSSHQQAELPRCG